MNRRKFRKDKITAWLIPLALVLSLFAFSGYSTPAASRPASKTEQVVRERSAKTAIYFGINNRTNTHANQYPIVCFQETLWNYLRTIKIQITQRLGHPPAVAKFKLLSGQHSLRSSDEDHIPSILG
jgi:hypothetical protein